MSFKKSIETTIDITALIGGSAVTVGGVISTFNAIKNKKGAGVIAGSIVVALVGIYATKGAIDSIRKKD